MLIKILFFLLIICGLTLFFNSNKDPSKKTAHPTEVQQMIDYRIGEVDPRFNVSVDDVKFLAYEATQIWEKGVNKTLFRYDPNATLSINLLYDERQQNSLYIDNINNTIDKKSNELDALNQRLETQLQNLKQRRQSLDTAYAALQQERSIWSLSEFESGENMQRLKRKEQQLRKTRDQLSNEWDTYHLNVQLYNEKVADFNQHAQQAREYNQKSPARMFHKGVFSGKRIDVYQFSNKNDLKVTLAHEFGHALGLSHHQEPKALMYPTMAQQDLENFELLPADIALFQQR